MSHADSRGRIARTWDRVSPDPVIERIIDAPVPEGFTAWRVDGSHVVLPTLSPLAPYDIQARYLARVVATARGVCSMCGAVASIDGSPERRAAWRILPVTVGLTHANGCPAEFTESDRHWFGAVS